MAGGQQVADKPKQDLFITRTVDTHQILGAWLTQDEAFLADDNTPARCEILRFEVEVIRAS